MNGAAADIFHPLDKAANVTGPDLTATIAAPLALPVSAAPCGAVALEGYLLPADGHLGGFYPKIRAGIVPHRSHLRSTS
jgi:hypothetical protein